MKVKIILQKCLNVFVWICAIFLCLVASFVALRVFVYDTFPVNSSSMYPTIRPGDKILANKLIFGARIYTSFDFSEDAPLESFRVKGLRKIKRNDIVLFNYTRKRGRYLGFAINQVFIKRCIGLPGDTISVVGGFYVNSSVADSVGYRSAQGEYLLDKTLFQPFQYYLPFGSHGRHWTIGDMGPAYIPRKGDRVKITHDNYLFYVAPVFYETSERLLVRQDSVFLGGKQIDSYEFRSNYYFMAGDNVSDSQDSRYFGVVPEEFIISVAPRILYSRNPHNGNINWSRVLKRME